MKRNKKAKKKSFHSKTEAPRFFSEGHYQLKLLNCSSAESHFQIVKIETNCKQEMKKKIYERD